VSDFPVMTDDDMENVQVNPMHVAVSNKSQDCISAILKDITVVQVNAGDSNGRTPLHYAADMSFEFAITALLASGALPEVTDRSGETPLEYSANQLLLSQRNQWLLGDADVERAQQSSRAQQSRGAA
jgi:ankyrin repeat protein